MNYQNHNSVSATANTLKNGIVGMTYSNSYQYFKSAITGNTLYYLRLLVFNQIYPSSLNYLDQISYSKYTDGDVVTVAHPKLDSLQLCCSQCKICTCHITNFIVVDQLTTQINSGNNHLSI